MTDCYSSLGVRPVVNAVGTVTRLGGSLMPPEVVEAMLHASRHFVSMSQLNEAVSCQIAELIGVESVAITTGAAGAITMGTAACVTGGDPSKAAHLPDTTGMRSEVLVQPVHRIYEAQIQLVGTQLVEVETAAELRATISSNTAMMFFANTANFEGAIRRKEWIAIAKEHGIATFCDAAADVPPLSRLSEYVELGFDLVAFSGGKGLRGPQNSGLLLGCKNLVDAARAHGELWSGIGRALKVGKEEVMGLLAAVERFVQLDHEAELAEYNARVKVVAEKLAGVEGVRTEVFIPRIANHVPHLSVEWDTRQVVVSAPDVHQQLSNGDPAIEVGGHNSMGSESNMEVHWTGVTVSVWTLQPGEAEVVGERLRQVLTVS